VSHRTTGLYYYGARYYNPRLSIWYGVDPLVEKTMASYIYCGNNPVRYIDPKGLQKEDIILIHIQVVQELLEVHISGLMQTML
jgi:hypothetical protein